MSATVCQIAARIECLLSSDTDVGMAKTIGVATLSLADCLGQMRPDLLLLIADRYEMLAPASVALALRIPIAHIEGGEISEGAIDDAVRNALTKMSHVHFTSTCAARDRVIAMGEEEWRVHRAGAPSIDHLLRNTLYTREQLEKLLHRTETPVNRGGVSSSHHRPRHHPGSRRTLRRITGSARANSVLLSQCGCGQPRVDRTHPSSSSQRTRDAHMFVNLPALTYWSLFAPCRT